VVTLSPADRDRLLADWLQAARGFPNARTLLVGLRAVRSWRRSVLRHHPDADRRAELRAAVLHYTTLLRAVRQLPPPEVRMRYRVTGFTDITSLRGFIHWMERHLGGTWHLTPETEDGCPRLWREAVPSFPASAYGVDLWFPEANGLASRWPNDPSGPATLGATEVYGLLEGTR
jgi:hypothetical protein